MKDSIRIIMARAMSDIDKRHDQRRHDCPCCTDTHNIIEKALTEVYELERRGTEGEEDSINEAIDFKAIEAIKPDVHRRDNYVVPPFRETPEG